VENQLQARGYPATVHFDILRSARSRLDISFFFFTITANNMSGVSTIAIHGNEYEDYI
jgi:hypothetical protein